MKIAAGKQCAVSGLEWQNGLRNEPQDYMVIPEQPWLDGFAVEKGVIRQFIAMPLGSGYSAEEQITGSAEHGGLQIAVYPMKREVFERRFPKSLEDESCLSLCIEEDDLGLAPGGRMRQEIYEDPYERQDWHDTKSSRCFVHLCNSMVWQSITGSAPPHPTLTAKNYTQAGLPWFDYYDDSQAALAGLAILAKLKSVTQKSFAKGEVVLPENESVTPTNVIEFRKELKREQVREGQF